MGDQAKADELQNRLEEFAARIIKLADNLPGSKAGQHIAGQVLRSGTSPAPNYGEARGAESRADFKHKLGIVQKELNETVIWLRVIRLTGLIKTTRITDLHEEATQLARIRAAGFNRLWPTHGPAVDDPDTFLSAYIEHRRARERQIRAQLEAGPQGVKTMVAAMYKDVDKRLHPAAAHSVLAHLVDMVRRGEIACDGDATLDAVYRLAA